MSKDKASKALSQSEANLSNNSQLGSERALIFAVQAVAQAQLATVGALEAQTAAIEALTKEQTRMSEELRQELVLSLDTLPRLR